MDRTSADPRPPPTQRPRPDTSADRSAPPARSARRVFGPRQPPARSQPPHRCPAPAPTTAQYSADLDRRREFRYPTTAAVVSGRCCGRCRSDAPITCALDTTRRRCETVIRPTPAPPTRTLRPAGWPRPPAGTSQFRAPPETPHPQCATRRLAPTPKTFPAAPTPDRGPPADRDPTWASALARPLRGDA